MNSPTLAMCTERRVGLPSSSTSTSRSPAAAAAGCCCCCCCCCCCFGGVSEDNTAATEVGDGNRAVTFAPPSLLPLLPASGGPVDGFFGGVETDFEFEFEGVVGASVAAAIAVAGDRPRVGDWGADSSKDGSVD